MFKEKRIQDLQALVSSFGQAGLMFVGMVKDIQQARAQVMNQIDSPDLLGSAIYFSDPAYPDEIGVLDQASVNASADHLTFVDEFLKRRRLVTAKTSLFETVQSGRSGVYPSKMLEHDCYNSLLHTSQGPVIMQFAFRRGAQIDAQNIERSMRSVFDGRSSLVDATIDLIDRYGADLGRHLGLNAPQGHQNGVLVSTDISSSTALIDVYGEAAWTHHLERLYGILDKMANNYDGVFDRDSGDGGIIGLPADDDRALHLVRDLLQSYQRLKQDSGLLPSDGREAQAETFLRVAVSSGYFTAQVYGQVFNSKPDIRRTGLPYLFANRALGAAPRNRDSVVLTPDSKTLFDPNGMITARKILTRSTAIPHVYEIDLAAA